MSRSGRWFRPIICCGRSMRRWTSSFIRERVRHLYCADNGRPALDPVVLFKLAASSAICFGSPLERQLMREVQVNAAYRWFLGLRLRDKVPDASTLSQNAAAAFCSTATIYQEIFDEIVMLACRKGSGDGQGSLHRFDPPEGQRQQEQVRRGQRCRGQAAGVPGGAWTKPSTRTARRMASAS